MNYKQLKTMDEKQLREYELPKAVFSLYQKRKVKKELHKRLNEIRKHINTPDS